MLEMNIMLLHSATISLPGDCVYTLGMAVDHMTCCCYGNRRAGGSMAVY